MNMNIKKKFTAGLLMAALMVIGLQVLTETAQAQVEPTSLTLATNMPATVIGSGVSNQTSLIPIWQGRGLALSQKFNATSGSAVGTIWLYPSVDGTNIATAPFAQWTLTPNATTDVVATTNWSAASLTGYRFLNVGAISNAAAGTVWITNKGLTISRPNSS